MMNKTTVSLLLALAFSAAAHAQDTTCPCNGGVGTRLVTAAAVQSLVANKMVCADLGSEKWQEWHNGSSSGPLVDYKQGPASTVDPSKTVGSFAVVNNTNARAGAGIQYTYGSQNYTYAVCQTGATYAFCGAAFGGRDITGVAVATTNGLQSCSGVSANSSLRSKR